MKNMLETQFPGIDVVLANYPPPAPKRILSKLVPVAQVGVFAIIMAGDQIFPRLGMSPPPWYYSLRANRFGTISATWLFGNFIQSYLQSSGAFEVFFDGQPVSSWMVAQFILPKYFVVCIYAWGYSFFFVRDLIGSYIEFILLSLGSFGMPSLRCKLMYSLVLRGARRTEA